MKPLLTELWPQFCADADFVAGYAGALVERVEADRKKRIIKVVYRTVAPVAGELRTRLCASLAPLFPGFLVCLQGLFEYDRLTPQSVLDLAMELRISCSAISTLAPYKKPFKGRPSSRSSIAKSSTD